MAATPSSPHQKRRKVEEDEHRRRHWPEGVIQEILVRLPTKSILRFKSTCKTWYSLIRSRSLIQFHCRLRAVHHHHRHHLFFSRHRGSRSPYKKDALYEISCFSPSSSSPSSTPLFDLRTLHKAVVEDGLIELIRSVKKCIITNMKGESGIHALGPLSNGIICVVSEVFLKRIEDSECASICKIAFCNPATREFKFVGYSPLIRKGVRARVLDYAHYYGFASLYRASCSDSVAADYKMVAIQQHKNQSFEARVYSLRRHTWDLICDSHNLERYSSAKVLAGLVNEQGKVEFPEITQDLYWLPAQALLNGCCHWMARKHDNQDSSVVLQFDMANEVFGLIAGPRDAYYNLLGYRVQRGVFVLNDHLAAVIVVHGLIPRVTVDHIDVWMMMEYRVEASWKKIHSCDISLHGNLERLLGMSFSRRTSGLHDGVTIERIFFQLDDGNLMSCGRSGLETHTTFDRYWVCWKPLGFSAYVETLEPLELEGMDEDTSSADVETLEPLKQEGSDEDTSE